MNTCFSPPASGRARLLPRSAAAALLALLAGGAAFAAPAPTDDTFFLPDGAQLVAKVRVNQILNSDALQQVWKSLPDAKKAFDTATGQSMGIDVNNVESVYLGAGKVDFTAPKPPAFTVVIHYQKPVKVADFEAAIKKSAVSGPFSINYTFADTKVGDYTMTEVKMAISFNPPPPPGGAAPPPAPPAPMPTTLFAFTMPDDNRLVIGTADSLQAVLKRNAAPTIDDQLKSAMKLADFDASVAVAVNAKGLVTPPSAPGGPSLDKVQALGLTIKVDKDVDVTATAACADAAAAKELSDSLTKSIADAKKQATSAPKPPPPELLDLMDVTPKVSGSNVTIQKTLKTEALISLIKSGALMPSGPAVGPPPPPTVKPPAPPAGGNPVPPPPPKGP